MLGVEPPAGAAPVSVTSGGTAISIDWIDWVLVRLVTVTRTGSPSASASVPPAGSASGEISTAYGLDDVAPCATPEAASNAIDASVRMTSARRALEAVAIM